MGIERRVFITGGTRGLGLELAREFLVLGAKVFVTGRSETSVKAALGELAAAGGGRVAGGWGDAAEPAELARLAEEAALFFGAPADLVISNAGVPQDRGRLWEVGFDAAMEVLRVDLGGPLAAVSVFMPGLSALAGAGAPAALWFIEGHGSTGSVIPGISVYGTAKRALAYLWRALAVEARGTGVLVGALSPGIMATDFVKNPSRRGPPGEWEGTKRVLDILGDRPETVARFAVPRILGARKGGRIAWLTTPKVFLRFATAAFRKRRGLFD